MAHLSASHIDAVIALPEERWRSLLSAAAEGGWSVTRLREEARGRPPDAAPSESEVARALETFCSVLVRIDLDRLLSRWKPDPRKATRLCCAAHVVRSGCRQVQRALRKFRPPRGARKRTKAAARLSALHARLRARD